MNKSREKFLVSHGAPPQVADRGTLTRYGGYRGNKILSTGMDVLRRSARKSRMDRIKNEIMGAKGKPDITGIIERKILQ
jgi:hypothetical protein